MPNFLNKIVFIVLLNSFLLLLHSEFMDKKITKTKSETLDNRRLNGEENSRAQQKALASRYPLVQNEKSA